MKKIKINSYLKNKFFYIVIILNMLPILLYHFFPTMDGAAHLYNSNIINELVLNPNGFLSNYFLINPEPVPNWLSHFLLAISNLIFPAWIAEKILLLIYFIFLPLSFRALIKVFNEKAYLSYLIFPFTYSFLFYIGFYNFCLAFILLFYTIRYWLLNHEKNRLKFILILFVLISITYFSHILVYSFLLFIIFVLLSQMFIQYIRYEGFSKNILTIYLKKYLVLFFASLPSLLLFINFYFSREFILNNENIDNSILIKWIKDIRPIIALIYDAELRLTEVLYHLFIGLTAILFYNRINKIDFSKKSTSNKIIFAIRNGLFHKTDVFLFITLITVLIYFNVSSNSGAGMMSERFNLLIYLFYILWLSIQVFPKWLMQFSVTIILIVNFGFVYRYTLATKGLSMQAVAIYNTANHIKPYSTVLPINYSDNWLSPHFSNYLGVDKPLIILENYEADVGWFPILWNNKMSKITLGSIEKENLCLHWKSSHNNNNKPADYIFIYGNNKDKAQCKQKVSEMINLYYNIEYQNIEYGIKLFKLKQIN